MDNSSYTQGFDTQFTNDFNILPSNLTEFLEEIDAGNPYTANSGPTANTNANTNTNVDPAVNVNASARTTNIGDGSGDTPENADGSINLNRSGGTNGNDNVGMNTNTKPNPNSNSNPNPNPYLMTGDFLSDNAGLQFNGLDYPDFSTGTVNNGNNTSYSNVTPREYFTNTVPGEPNVINDLPSTMAFSPPLSHTVAPVPVVAPERTPNTAISMSAPVASLPMSHKSPLSTKKPSTAEPDVSSNNYSEPAYPPGNPPSPSKLRRLRAKGETLEILKREFETNPSPSIEQRRKIAKVVGMPEKNVTIWFQNRRAKFKKKQRSLAAERQRYSPMRAASAGKPYTGVGVGVTGEMKEGGNDISEDLGLDSSGGEIQIPAFVDKFKFFDRIPFDYNSDYNFVDVCSVTIGTWNRMKSGSILKRKFKFVKELKNLSPNSVSTLMLDSTDLLVLISQKNFEVNYFFIAIANNTKILFRVFYSIDSIIDCSLTTEAGSSEELLSPGRINSIFGEFRIVLSKSPNFAVYFLNSNERDPGNANQWSICEDFSEGRQVSTAYVGGTNIPHCLKGLHNSLKSMNNLISRYKSRTQLPPTSLGTGIPLEPPTIPLSPGADRLGLLSLTPISPSISPNMGLSANFSPVPLGSYFEDAVTSSNDFITRIYSNDSLTNSPSQISGSLQHLVENYDRSRHSSNTKLGAYQSPARESIEHVASALSQPEQGSAQNPSSDFLEESVTKLTGDTDDNLPSNLGDVYGGTADGNLGGNYFGFGPNFNPEGGQDIAANHLYDTTNDNNNNDNVNR